MPNPRDLLPPLPGEPPKFVFTLALIEVLADLFDLPMGQVEKTLRANGLSSYDVFKTKVWDTAKTLTEEWKEERKELRR